MDSSKGIKLNPYQHKLKEGYEDEDDLNYVHDYEVEDDDDDDIDDEEFCSSVLQPQSNEIIGGINLKDLCEGKEVMFEMNGKFLKSDEEQYYEQEDDGDYNDEETVNILPKGDFERPKEKQTNFFLNESFESLVSRMTSITDDDCVKKEEVISGFGKVIPENSYAIVHYNLFKATSEEPFDSTYLRNRPERINLGQSDLILGLEIAIKTMKKKENSLFFISWKYAFGPLGCPDRIEPKCDIIADITLLNFKEIDVLGLISDCGSWFERGVVKIKLEQTSGSDSFKEGKIKQAISKYKRSVRMINNLGITNDSDEMIFNELKVKSLVNLAICYNKLNQYELACVMCQEALSISPRNTKALFHYARASLALSNFSKARSLLMKLNKMNPHNKDVVEELRKLEQKKELYNMASQKFWKRAFMSTSEEAQRKDQNSNSPCRNSTVDMKGGFEEGFERSAGKSQEHRLVDPLTKEEEITTKFAQNMKFEEEYENFMQLE